MYFISYCPILLRLLQRYLHRLFLAIDANFRLKRKNVSSHEADPGLSNGWSYFVGESDYKDFLQAFGNLAVQPVRFCELNHSSHPHFFLQRSTCSNHNAVNAERSMKGLAATGVGAVDCARHDVKHPVSVTDLHRGERYVLLNLASGCVEQKSSQIS